MSQPAEMDISSSSRETLRALISAIAQDKAAMGRRYGEWAVSAPTLESGVAAAAMAQDELGHARATFPLLKQLGVEGDHEADRMETTSTLALLEQPLPDWETFIAVNLVVDEMLTAFIGAARDSSFVPLAQRARKILQEERSHHVHAVAWTRRLASDDAGRPRLSAAITTCWQQVAGWPGDDTAYEALVSDGLVASSPDSLRADIRAAVATALDGTDLALELS
jgi:phenylacetate-CoA oxygenase PaaI subunit